MGTVSGTAVDISDKLYLTSTSDKFYVWKGMKAGDWAPGAWETATDYTPIGETWEPLARLALKVETSPCLPPKTLGSQPDCGVNMEMDWNGDEETKSLAEIVDEEVKKLHGN